MAVTTVVLGVIGWKLDDRWDTDPWLLLTGLVGGFAIGLAMLFRGLARLQSDDDSPDHHQPPDPEE